MDRRRIARQHTEIRAELFLCRDGRDNRQAGPLAVTVVDISPQGAGLVMASIRAGGHHFFYAPHDDERFFLSLACRGPQGEEHYFAARPVWFNKDLTAEPACYRLGIVFLEQTDVVAVRTVMGVPGPGDRLAAWLRERF